VTDTLFNEFNSLSVLYHRPAATFAADTAPAPLLQGAPPVFPAPRLSARGGVLRRDVRGSHGSTGLSHGSGRVVVTTHAQTQPRRRARRRRR